MEKEIDVSIIIVNYNTADLILDCIKSISAKTDGIVYEIIVVDNASRDDSVIRLESAFPGHVSVVSSTENLGFGKGNNLGVKYASGRYLFLLNPDTYLLNNAIKTMADFLDTHPEAGIVGGDLYFPDQSPASSFCLKFDTPESEHEAASWKSLISGKLSAKTAHLKGSSKLEGFNYSELPIQVGYIFGADMMIRQELFRSLGGFDPEFFMYAEEEELSWRVKKAGFEIVNLPDARIVHLEGASTQGNGGFNERQFRMRMNGKLIYYKKCFGLEGMESFFQSRKKMYQHQIDWARLRGRDPRTTQAYRMLSCLIDEYRNYKKCQLQKEN